MLENVMFTAEPRSAMAHFVVFHAEALLSSYSHQYYRIEPFGQPDCQALANGR
jgi:hypothetical protein